MFNLIYSCKAPGCESAAYRNRQNKRFFKFPKDPDARRLWKQFCNIAEDNDRVGNFRVCEDHFLEADFYGVKGLLPRAVPQQPQRVVEYVTIENEHCYCKQPGALFQDHDYCKLAENDSVSQLNFVAGPSTLQTVDTDELQLVETENNVPQLNQNVAPISATSQPGCLFVQSSIIEQSTSDYEAGSTAANAQPGCSFWPTNLITQVEENAETTQSFSVDEEILENPNFNQNSSQNDFSFLTKPLEKLKHRSGGMLSKIGLKFSELTPTKREMLLIHRNAVSRISKLKAKLSDERTQFKKLTKLYESNRFQIIEDSLNTVTKEFINCQLLNHNRRSCARRYTDELKLFALSMYKRSPRLYRYLQLHFELPCPRLLKRLLNSMSFETGFNNSLLQNLRDGHSTV